MPFNKEYHCKVCFWVFVCLFCFVFVLRQDNLVVVGRFGFMHQLMSRSSCLERLEQKVGFRVVAFARNPSVQNTAMAEFKHLNSWFLQPLKLPFQRE